MVERLLTGGFATRGLPEDALALATLETGVPVWAVDADRLGARSSWRPTRTAGSCSPTPRAPSRSCSAARAGTGAEPRTRALALLAVQAPGVEEMFVEESVWTAVAAMRTIDIPS